MLSAQLRLPARPIAVRKSALSAPHGFAFLSLIILAFTGFIGFWQLPDLLQDIEISRNPVLLEDAQVRDGECTTRKGIFTDCEARLVYERDGRSYDKEVHLFFVDLHSGDYEAGVVVSADHPELATLTIGIDKLWNRIISLGLLLAILGGSAVVLLFIGLRALRVKARLSTPAMLEPIPVAITAYSRTRRGLYVTYADKLADRKTKRTAHSDFRGDEEPLVIGVEDGKAVGLAVRHGNAALPILLDGRLQRLELTEAERQAALAPIAAELEAVGGATVLGEEKRKPKILRGILTFLLLIALIPIAALGYWLWYVTSAPTQFEEIGMEINYLLPKPMNEWGCDQLQKRFGHDRAPFGCTAGDYTSWK